MDSAVLVEAFVKGYPRKAGQDGDQQQAIGRRLRVKPAVHQAIPPYCIFQYALSGEVGELGALGTMRLLLWWLLSPLGKFPEVPC